MGCFQVYRKAALKIVRDLGEDALPEPTTTAAVADAATETKVEDQVPPPPVTSEDTASTTPSSTETSTTSEPPESTEKTVTTEERKPLNIPDSVQLRITPENLKDYVGPPIYHKDRFYIRPPPAGVSTGLGYLGNGSGAVMPVEATVSVNPFKCFATSF